MSLTERHIGLAAATAHGHKDALAMVHGLDVDDLAQEGAVGLMRAEEGFDPDKGLTFASHASARVNWSILDALREKFEHGRTRWDDLVDYRKALETLEAELQTTVDPNEVIDALDLSPDRDRALRAVVHSGLTAVSLNEQIFEENETATNSRLSERQDFLVDTDVDVERDAEYAVLLGKFKEALETLPKDQATVLWEHVIEDRTLTDIGKSMGVTQGRVSQILKKARQGVMPLLKDFQE